MRILVLGSCAVLAMVMGYGSPANADSIVTSWNFDDVAAGAPGVDQGITSETGWTQFKINPSYPTNWELGTPVFSGQGLVGAPADGAYSGSNAVATDLNGPYENWPAASTPVKVLELYTPAIDLTTLSDATLKFVDWCQVESGDIGAGFDYCTIEVLDTNLNHLGWLDQAIDDLNKNGWVTDNSYSLNSFVGQQVKLGFALNVDNFGAYSGWYIDNVQVTTSASAAPEPMTLMLLGSGALVLLRRKRA